MSIIYGLVWKNKYMSANSKVRIYKICVRPVMTNAAESRASTITTQQLLWTTEMRIIRAIHGKTLRDRIRNKDLRELSGIPDTVDYIDVRRRGWGNEWRMTVLQKLWRKIAHRVRGFGGCLEKNFIFFFKVAH